MIFRFDDICMNTNIGHASELVDIIRQYCPMADVLWCVSPIAFDMHANASHITRQRVFPKILNAHSDHRQYYRGSLIGKPGGLPVGVELASHGLIHVDHRLLCRGAQELSIIASCEIVGTRTYCPPFNKWNTDTVAICEEQGIKLIRFEDGWLCAEYEPYAPEHKLWYLHSREITTEQLRDWFEDGVPCS